MCTKAQLITPHLHDGQPLGGARWRALDVVSHDPDDLEEFGVALLAAAEQLRAARAVHLFAQRKAS